MKKAAIKKSKSLTCVCEEGHPYNNMACPVHGIFKQEIVNQNREIYALENHTLTGHSIFLAGPTPRDHVSPSWRPDMIKVLRDKGYNGDILIPERRGNYLDYDYETHTDWEVKHLYAASIILFWVPRELKTMPAFTTNIEFGEFMHSGKVVLSYPKNAEKMRYLHIRATKHNIPIFHTMKKAADYVLKNL